MAIETEDIVKAMVAEALHGEKATGEQGLRETALNLETQEMQKKHQDGISTSAAERRPWPKFVEDYTTESVARHKAVHKAQGQDDRQHNDMMYTILDEDPKKWEEWFISSKPSPTRGLIIKGDQKKHDAIIQGVKVSQGHFVGHININDVAQKIADTLPEEEQKSCSVSSTRTNTTQPPNGCSNT